MLARLVSWKRKMVENPFLKTNNDSHEQMMTSLTIKTILNPKQSNPMQWKSK